MKNALSNGIATKISDYRLGEIPVPDRDHVLRWINQFDTQAQIPILQEMDYLIDRVYIRKNTVQRFLQGILVNTALTGTNPDQFWRNANILSIQQGGSSQLDINNLFDQILQSTFGYGIANCGSNNGIYIYFDDICYSGNRIKTDIDAWLKTIDTDVNKIIIITMAYHTGGQWYADTNIKKIPKIQSMRTTLEWWRLKELENRKRYIRDSDILSPKSLPRHNDVIAYVQFLTAQGYPPVLRPYQPTQSPPKFFSSENGRDILEQEFLKTGSYIRRTSGNLPQNIRPLGFNKLLTLGFGSIIITYRNISNTCPVALWAGDPWYPLFPRKTN